MNKGQSSILVIGDGPVTRLEECTWNESRRISTLFWKALFSSEVPSTLEILHIAVTYSPNPNFRISRVVSGPCALQRDPSVPEAHELISRKSSRGTDRGGSKDGCNSEALSDVQTGAVLEIIVLCLGICRTSGEESSEITCDPGDRQT